SQRQHGDDPARGVGHHVRPRVDGGRPRGRHHRLARAWGQRFWRRGTDAPRGHPPRTGRAAAAAGGDPSRDRRWDSGRADDGDGGRPGPGQILTLPIAGRSGVPTSARAVRVNVVATAPAATTYVTAYPCQRDPPPTSTLNLEAGGQSQANGAIVPLGSRGSLC